MANSDQHPKKHLEVRWESSVTLFADNLTQVFFCQMANAASLRCSNFVRFNGRRDNGPEPAKKICNTMNTLINNLLLFGNLNKQQIQLVLSKCVKHEIKRDEFYQEAGRIPSKFAFLVNGVFRVSYYNNKGEEVTKYFLNENHFVVDLDSYNQRKPFPEYILAVTDCTYITLSREALKELSVTIAGWNDMLNKIISKALVEKVSKVSMMMAEDATERYLNFFNRFPKLANWIPLSYLASYLDITQSSLSRIRRSVNN